jgi:hypothetical protein
MALVKKIPKHLCLLERRSQARCENVIKFIESEEKEKAVLAPSQVG